MQFVTPMVGWCGDYSTFQKTTDGGLTWRVVKLPASAKDLRQFQLLSPIQGWVRTFDALFWSEDGGATWRQRTLPFKPHNEKVGQHGLVDDMIFATPQTGWALGMKMVRGDASKEWIRYRIHDEHTVYVPALFQTTDGGHTWTPLRYPDLRLLPYRLELADRRHLLSVELNATQFSRDGGHTWAKSRYCRSVRMKDLRYAELGTGTFMGTTAQLLDTEYGWWSVNGDLFRTTDGGATWCQLPSIQLDNEALIIAEIRFFNRKLGWAVPTHYGPEEHPAPPFESTDGGTSWMPIKTPLDARIEGVSVLPEGTVFFWGDGNLYRLVRN